MIVFLDKPNLIGEIQFRFNRAIEVFNLSSLYSGFIDVTDLLTKINIITNSSVPLPVLVESVDFDLIYASGVINDPNLFCKFMSIMSASYEGIITIVLVQHDFYRDAIMESIIKLIQQRYGYNCWIVEEIEDIYCLSEGTYSPTGLMNLNNDLKRYDSLCSNSSTISVE